MAVWFVYLTSSFLVSGERVLLYRLTGPPVQPPERCDVRCMAQCLSWLEVLPMSCDNLSLSDVFRLFTYKVIIDAGHGDTLL